MWHEILPSHTENDDTQKSIVRKFSFKIAVRLIAAIDRGQMAFAEPDNFLFQGAHLWAY